jgi:hypothetical protein
MTDKNPRRPHLSAAVRSGLLAIADRTSPETVDEIAAISWIRRMVWVVESRQRRRHDAGARVTAPVDPRGGGAIAPAAAED